MEKTPCTAVQTAHGFLFFTNDTRGANMLQWILQQMTDQYFDPAFDYGPVKIYDLKDVPVALLGRLNLTDNLQDRSHFLPIGVMTEAERQNMTLRYESKMEPTSLSFFLFSRTVGTEESLRNENIRCALAAMVDHQQMIKSLSNETHDAIINERIAEIREYYRLQKQLLNKAYDVRGQCVENTEEQKHLTTKKNTIKR